MDQGSYICLTTISLDAFDVFIAWIMYNLLNIKLLLLVANWHSSSLVIRVASACLIDYGKYRWLATPGA